MEDATQPDNANVEYVSEQLDSSVLGAFSDVFAKFRPPPEAETSVRGYNSHIMRVSPFLGHVDRTNERRSHLFR